MRHSAIIYFGLLGCTVLVAGAQSAGTNAGVAKRPLAAASQQSDYAGSASCRECHGKFYRLWSTSFHGLAMQPYSAQLARTKLTAQKNEVVAGQFSFRADIAGGVVIERHATNETRYPITQVLGGKNVFYFLTPLARGWLQVLPVAYDVRRHEWFDTTASAMRHFGNRSDEALYWKERPLTFNTSCFSCHVSQLAKNYDAASDSYHTAWAEPGINCETCHGPSAGHVKLFHDLPTNAPVPADIQLVVTSTMTTEQRNDLCAPCHAKMSPVTMNFAPGERYFDHFDLIAYENPDFYPDGRDLGENYTFTSWRQSACAKSGQLDCMHCHTSSGRYKFKEPATANEACLPCHEDQVKNAVAHTHHKIGSTGGECIACHMPTTEFARMRRSDHSMRPPTPATTLAYQSPNACNLCHADKTAAWADQLVRAWSKNDFQKPVLERAALIDAARKNDWKKLPAMLAFLSATNRDELLAVSLVRLLGNCPSDDKWPVLRRLTQAVSPLVRAAAAETLGGWLDEANITALIKASGDDFRLVRVRAANALAGVPEASLPDPDRSRVGKAMAELTDSLLSRPDDMTAHYNLGNVYMARNQLPAAVTEFENAIQLQPDFFPPYVNAAVAYNTLGQNDQAEARLRRALQLDPTNSAALLNLGMLLAEMKQMTEAEKSFRAAFKADPQSAQAAYNLGVLLAKGNAAEALTWCRRAAELQPDNPQYGYTYAFFLHRAGQLDEALRVIRAVRQLHPEHAESATLEQALLRESARLQLK